MIIFVVHCTEDEIVLYIRLRDFQSRDGKITCKPSSDPTLNVYNFEMDSRRMENWTSAVDWAMDQRKQWPVES